MSLGQVIKTEALRLGFSLAGITTPDSPTHFSVYENWLDQGRHGCMDYLAGERARNCRRDPRLLLPECQSILVLGMRYPNPGTKNLFDKNAGRIAAYAWGQDYHVSISEQLKTLASFIEKTIGKPLKCRWYTDTGPILERDLAQRAGLGWIGKNSCLINPGMGSYFFIAEILLDIELEPDPPFPFDRCGTCMRCIEACPTGCILPDRTLQSQRCIAALTIENKGDIPVELREAVGNWVFGCDICQMVCPWNRFTVMDGIQNSFPIQAIRTADLLQDLRLSSREFNARFKNYAILRTKRRGYLRNIAVALGNIGNWEAISSLEHALQDEEPLIQRHAEWAIKQIREKDRI